MAGKTRTQAAASKATIATSRSLYKPSIVLLMVLQPFMLIFGFVLLTEPCLNPSYRNNLVSKLDYISILGTIPVGEWGERFRSAGMKSLFGTLVVQAWYVARLNAYVQKASGQEGVASFIRQLESVSLSLLSLPLLITAFYLMCIIAGTPVSFETVIISSHLALLLALPPIHILGLPPSESPKPNTTQPSTFSSLNSNPTSTSTPNSHKFWSNLLALNPTPRFLLPLYYPPFFTLSATLLSSAALALDWDVAWQTYPYPLLVGSLTGLLIGNLFTIFIILFD